MFEAEIRADSPRQWPQPGEVWSGVMVAKYGALILSVEAAFDRVLRSAPPISEAEQELDDQIKEMHRDLWSIWIHDDLEKLFALARQLPLSRGIEKKIDRIKSHLEDCDENWKSAQSLSVSDEEKYAAMISDPARRKLSFEIRALRQDIIDDLEEMNFYLLKQDHISLYESAEPLFGEEVFRRFGIANDDIAEAGKCLAMGRSTAAVFHLMRVTEAGLKALGKELGIPYAPSWESYTRQLDSLLDPANYKKLSADKLAKRDFYAEVLGDITAVKRAWRNPTMHIVRSFDAEQAKLIFEATRSLMQHLARELSADPSDVILTGQGGP